MGKIILESRILTFEGRRNAYDRNAWERLEWLKLELKCWSCYSENYLLLEEMWIKMEGNTRSCYLLLRVTFEEMNKF